MKCVFKKIEINKKKRSCGNNRRDKTRMRSGKISNKTSKSGKFKVKKSQDKKTNYQKSRNRRSKSGKVRIKSKKTRSRRFSGNKRRSNSKVRIKFGKKGKNLINYLLASFIFVFYLF